MDKHNPSHQARLKAALGLHAILFLRDPKKELDDARVLLYWKQLEQYEMEDVETAAFNLQGKLRKFPLPIDLREECERIVQKRGDGKVAAPNPRPPGAQPWCDEPGCDDTGFVPMRKPLREFRDVPEDDPMGDVMHNAVRKCACWSINPVRRWREQQNRAGVIRREEKQDNNWTPNRRGQLVQFRR